MLVLSRKLGETIIIGKDGGIHVTVVDIDRGKIRLGIVADKSIPIFREEIWLEMQKTQEPSAPAGN